MSVKAQYFKCGLCAVFYLIVCFILINMKKSYNLKEKSTNNLIATKRQQTPGFSIPDRIIKNVESEIDMLRIDELKGETIDLQV